MKTEPPMGPDLRSLDDATRILRRLRKELAPGSSTVWQIVDHACDHLEQQIREEIREDAYTSPKADGDRIERLMYVS